MTQDEVEREFGILRDLTRRTGMLAEIQLTQLKKWPTVILNRKSEVIFSPEDRAVLYDIQGEGIPDEAALGYISHCTKWLLGKDIRVGVRSSTDSWVSDEQPANSAPVSDD